MTTPLYVLCPEGHAIVDSPSPVGPARKVTVQNGDWYQARAKAILHANDQGHKACIIMVNYVNLAHRPHWNGLGEPTSCSAMGPEGKHGLWLYMDRLLRRFAHVYVPPITACRSWKSMRKMPWLYLNSPTLPLVAGYQVRPLLSLDVRHPFGMELCRRGYDSLTVSDYFYDPVGGEYVFDEFGSATVWDKLYRRAVEARL